ncbi:hypothetical protein TIFTF001_015611 [Ficus carica]|uniref:Uncharacterized protein n=1 Tax=Ficus carica TaxID=3494 RepID=A0AA88A1I5_FICCA|nr:hypothetical protein TIFTF001_015611 [Ficus carica]
MSYGKQVSSLLHISDFKDVAVLDDDVVHVHGLEAVEVLGERDEVDGGALVELKEVRVVVVPLPPQRRQLVLQHLVRRYHLVARRVDQHLPPPAPASVQRIGPRVLHQPDHPVLEHPNS